MGMFLSVTSIIGKSKEEAINSLAKYAETEGGGLVQEDLSMENRNCCVMEQANGNTTILNPYDFLDWDESSEFISRDLKAPVFSFHIHDGDLWMYTLFVNGEIVDQFNPIPDYWSDELSEEEIESQKGDAVTVSKYVPAGKSSAIENYLIRWDLEAEEPGKAYPDDQFDQEDWQLLDFMRKLGLPYPLAEDGSPKAQTFKLWTKELPLKAQAQEINMEKKLVNGKDSRRPWWKFW